MGLVKATPLIEAERLRSAPRVYTCGFEQTFGLPSGDAKALLKTVVDLLARRREARPHQVEEALLRIEIKTPAVVNIDADDG